MRIGKMIVGILASVMACFISVFVTSAVINSEVIMFDKYNMNKLNITLICPGVIQVVIYIVWFLLKTMGESRDVNRLAKNSLLICAMSFVVSVLLLFGLASLLSLWGDGDMFLIIAAVLYAIAGMIQYMSCRPF